MRWSFFCRFWAAVPHLFGPGMSRLTKYDESDEHLSSKIQRLQFWPSPETNFSIFPGAVAECPCNPGWSHQRVAWNASIQSRPRSESASLVGLFFSCQKTIAKLREYPRFIILVGQKTKKPRPMADFGREEGIKCLCRICRTSVTMISQHRRLTSSVRSPLLGTDCES